MSEVYKPHTNREAVGVWLCSAAKRPSKRCAIVYLICKWFFNLKFRENIVPKVETPENCVFTYICYSNPFTFLFDS